MHKPLGSARMKGRINIVDLAALILLLAILPLAYGASLLFQTSRPQITEVGQVDITNAERRIVAGGSLLSAKLKVKGSGFNPMLRAYIGDAPALAFVYENPNSADVLAGPLPPGAHDLILMDGVQEVARAVGVVKIESPSSRVVRAEGWLTNMEPGVADRLQVGAKFPPGAPAYEIVALGPAQPARSRIRFGNASADYPIANRVERQAVMLLRCDPTGEELRTGQEAVHGWRPVGAWHPASGSRDTRSLGHHRILDRRVVSRRRASTGADHGARRARRQRRERRRS